MQKLHFSTSLSKVNFVAPEWPVLPANDPGDATTFKTRIFDGLVTLHKENEESQDSCLCSLFSQTSGRLPRVCSGFVNIDDGFSCADAFPNVNESRSRSSVSKGIEGRKEPQQQKERIIIIVARVLLLL